MAFQVVLCCFVLTGGKPEGPPDVVDFSCLGAGAVIFCSVVKEIL